MTYCISKMIQKEDLTKRGFKELFTGIYVNEDKGCILLKNGKGYIPYTRFTPKTNIGEITKNVSPIFR